MTDHSHSLSPTTEADEVRPPPGFDDVLAKARRIGRPAWDMQLDKDLVFFGWAGHTSEGAQGMPLGRPEEVIPCLRELADKLERATRTQSAASAGGFMLKA